MGVNNRHDEINL